MPYLGLKSAQAVNMFSNLRLEGGVSNHLILPHPPGPFGYPEDIAVIEHGGGDGRLAECGARSIPAEPVGGCARNPLGISTTLTVQPPPQRLDLRLLAFEGLVPLREGLLHERRRPAARPAGCAGPSR